MKEDIGQVKVAVPIKDIWKAMTRDSRHLIPKFYPHLTEEIELLEGDGGVGSIYLVKFAPDVPIVRYQKEKILELDESLHQFTVEIVEGGRMVHKFSSYRTTFKLTAVAEAETVVDVKILYETKPEHTHSPGDTLKTT